MSDRLTQRLAGAPLTELDEVILSHDIAATVKALGRNAKNLQVPVALDWANLKIEIEPGGAPFNGNIVITASAPVL